jgi:hypothetical protein
MAIRYEFRSYDENGNFIISKIESRPNEAAARNAAGRLSKRNNGPVDLAEADDRPWDWRYITTAAPSEYHASGYRFERLD